jgi:tRNA (guanine37-N1)-methyltransferase
LGKKLRETFAEALPMKGGVSVYSAFDIVGDIAIIKTPTDSVVSAVVVAEAILSRHGNVKTVFLQDTRVHGDFRLRGLTYVTGEKRTCTVHKELGCSFEVDIKKCYFSPRLSGERIRIASLVKQGETVVNMFAGVGCFSILIAKRVATARVYSIDINPVAIKFMTENIRRNRVYPRVVPLEGDAKSIVQTQLLGCADRVLMPLPEKALEYLPIAVSALKTTGGWIHVHVFEHAAKTENPVEKAKLKVTQTLTELKVNFEVPLVRIVRRTGPNWFQLAADVHLSP